MRPLLDEIRNNRLLWCLALVPVMFVADAIAPNAHELLFILSVLSIVPLAALLSRATEAVAAKTGDSVGGLLNATLGNLTELIIALTALHAGQYVLVKASIAGAIVTNTLFMLGASLLLGGLKHHVQEYNRNTARLQGGLLFLATVALLVPSMLAQADSSTANASNSASATSLASPTMSTFSWKCSRNRPRCDRSYRNSCGIENQRSGFRSALALAPTIRANVGVISGRNATWRSPLSLNSYSCPTISSPLFLV